MSSALAIAAVTAFLKSLLENGLVDEGVNASIGGDAVVSVLPPDRITTGSDERPQLNLFLHQATPHASLRSGERSGQRTMLGLDLHYLLTAYGAQDLQIEILLATPRWFCTGCRSSGAIPCARRWQRLHRTPMAASRRQHSGRGRGLILTRRSIGSKFVRST